MGALSPYAAAPMPLGATTPYTAAPSGAYAQPTYAPVVASDALAGLAQAVAALSVAVQGLLATFQAQSAPNMIPSTAQGGGALPTGGMSGCGCGCQHGGSAPYQSPSYEPPYTPPSTPSRPPVPRTEPRSRPAEPDPAPPPPTRSEPTPAPKPTPAPPPGPAPSPAQSLPSGMAFPVPGGKVIQGPHSGGTHSSGPWHDSNALDIEAPEGTPIYAPADGVVSNAKGSNSNPAGRTNGFNMFLEGQGNEWFLTHMSKRVVNNGDHVKKGQLIGYVGSANNVPHLHIGQKQGNPADTFKL